MVNPMTTTREEQRDVVERLNACRPRDPRVTKCLEWDAAKVILELCAENDRLRASQAGGVPDDALRSKPDFHDDPVEQLAFELAVELEDAEMSPNDYVTVNREKLKAIARRVLARASPPPPATDGALESEGLVQSTVLGNGSVTGPVCQWQPIETAPKDGTWVLGCRPTSFREDQIDTWQFVHRSCDPPIWINSADSNDEDEQPTHWMPLPPRPDDRTNGSEAQSGSLNHALPASSVSATDAVEAERAIIAAAVREFAQPAPPPTDVPDPQYIKGFYEGQNSTVECIEAMIIARGTDEVGNG